MATNFQDAITITRSLGIRYLWIDSLCIIQDSKKDWATESRKTGLIYRDSTVILSAMASPGSRHGIIRSSGNILCADPKAVQLAIYPRTDFRTTRSWWSALALTRRTSTDSTHTAVLGVVAGDSKSPFCRHVSSTLVSGRYTGGILRVIAPLMVLSTRVKFLQTNTAVFLVLFIQS